MSVKAINRLCYHRHTRSNRWLLVDYVWYNAKYVASI